jgi:hypothetical protein
MRRKLNEELCELTHRGTTAGRHYSGMTQQRVDSTGDDAATSRRKRQISQPASADEAHGLTERKMSKEKERKVSSKTQVNT